MNPRRVRVRLGTSVLFAMAVLASSCGSGTTNSASFGQSVEQQATREGDQTIAGEQSDGDASINEGASAGANSQSSASSSSEAPVHLFPDLDVIDIQTGATLNLADELSGGDTPILLWFWAPH